MVAVPVNSRVCFVSKNLLTYHVTIHLTFCYKHVKIVIKKLVMLFILGNYDFILLHNVLGGIPRNNFYIGYKAT